MPLYENISCPVCNKKFEENDDIVYCPECGTPHHRDCYKAIGHCVNKGLHKSGYNFYDDYKTENNPNEYKSEPKAEEGAFYTPPSNLSDFKNEENQNEYPPFSQLNQIPVVGSVYERDDEKISGESVADFAAAIRTNAARFINLFKEFEYKKRKISWNWGAFFFGSLYLLFRKMFKQGIVFLCAFIAVVFGSAFAIIRLAPKYVAAVENLENLYIQGKMQTSDIQTLYSTSDYMNAMRIIYIMLGVLLVLRIVQALFADRFYKSTVTSIIKSVSEQLNEGAAFMQTSIFPNQNEELSQSQMKKIYLAKRGGVSFFIPFAAAAAVYILFSYL